MATMSFSKDRVMELRFHIAAVLLLAVAFASLLWLGPSLSTVVSFFWPLLLSTGFFLIAVALLLRISPPPSDAAADLAGEELMDYVAGQPHPQTQPTPEDEDEVVAAADLPGAAEEEKERRSEAEEEPEADHRKKTE